MGRHTNPFRGNDVISEIGPLLPCVCCKPATAVYKRRYKTKPRRTNSNETQKGLFVEGRTLKAVTSEADDGEEQIARKKTLKILASFFELRHELQLQQELGMSSMRTEQFSLTAGSIMMEQMQYSDFKGVGRVPGVRVGDRYTYRFEIVLIGLHQHLRSAISYVASTTELARRQYHIQNVACSIIACEDRSAFEGETLIFTVQYSKTINRRAETGNLALLNSCSMKLPVRVIQQHKVGGSVSGRIYTYIGLYAVERYVQEIGTLGRQMFRFFLRRESGQPHLRPTIQKVPSKLECLSLSPHQGLITIDISEGAEQTPVRLVNTADVDAPKPFHYTATVWYSDALAQLLPDSQGPSCDCNFGCKAGTCPCVNRNHGGLLAYNDDGDLLRVLDIVYECGKLCKCGPNCPNRVTQKGLQRPLEIFKTSTKGWGVRALESIPRGSFVCELTGELITATAASERENDEYLFNLDFQKGAELREERPLTKKHSKLKSSVEKERRLSDDVSADYVIDAREYGNVARFINHSCDPNLFVQGVLCDHNDMKRGHIMLFAGENIAALTELAYDYGYEVNSVRDIHGNVKAKICHCGSTTCRKRLY